MRFLLTADPGLEDVTVAELAERGLTGEARPFGYPGLVRAEAEEEAPLFSLRSVHHVVRFLGQARLSAPTLEAALDALSGFDLPGLGPGIRFAVRVHRRGLHDFQSPDLERAYGALLVERYRAPVDLETPDLRVRVDLFEDALFLGYQLTDRALSLRYPKVYAPPAALKTSVAFGLLRLLEVDGGRLLDAFTGSGTIAIEAAQVYPGLEVFALDKNPKAVRGAKANAARAGVADRIRFLWGDARRPGDAFGEASLDYVIANPPYGKRLGRFENLFWLYADFLASARRALRPGGRLGLLVLKRGWVDRILRRVGGFRLVHRRVIEVGGLYPGYFVLERSGD